MKLVSLREVVNPALEGKYAIPAFNFWTYEDLVGVLQAAQELRSPVIAMSSMSCVNYLGFETISNMVGTLAKRFNIPIVLHLDHAEEVGDVLKAIKAGYTSVMYDGSKLPIEENVKNTQFIVRVARDMGVTVEAEIGRVGRGEEGEDISQILSDPDEALEFFNATKVDALAIAAGTMHGMQTQQADLRFDIIDAISALVPVPLVLHGSSGVKNEDYPRLIKTGISKINIGTVLRNTFMQACRDLVQEGRVKNQIALFTEAAQAVTLVAKDKIERFGAVGKA